MTKKSKVGSIALFGTITVCSPWPVWTTVSLMLYRLSLIFFPLHESGSKSFFSVCMKASVSYSYAKFLKNFLQVFKMCQHFKLAAVLHNIFCYPCSGDCTYYLYFQSNPSRCGLQVIFCKWENLREVCKRL